MLFSIYRPPPVHCTRRSDMSRKNVLSEGDINAMLEAKIEDFDDKKKIEEAKAYEKAKALQRRSDENYNTLVKKLKDFENNLNESPKAAKSGYFDPFVDSEDRSVRRVEEIMKRKKPNALLSKTPSPKSMAMWILEDMKLPALKLEMKRRRRPTSITKKKIVAELLPILIDLIEKDRQEGRM